jgi:hypothetical protein
MGKVKIFPESLAETELFWYTDKKYSAKDTSP